MFHELLHSLSVSCLESFKTKLRSHEPSHEPAASNDSGEKEWKPHWRTQHPKYIYDFTTLNHSNSNLLQFFSSFIFNISFIRRRSVYERLQNGTVGKITVSSSELTVSGEEKESLKFLLS